MKIIYSLIILLNFSLFSQSLIQLKISESSSYLHFLQALFNPHRASKALANELSSYKSKISKFKKDYQIIQSDLQSGYGFPHADGGVWGEDILETTATHNETLKSFEPYLSYFLSPKSLHSYYRIKKEFYPLFKKHLWEEAHDHKQAELSKAHRILNSKKLQKWLKNIKQFYQSSMIVNKLPITVSLIPLSPKHTSSNHTQAKSLNAVQVVPYIMPVGITESVDVIIHEFCHFFFHYKKRNLKKLINDFYNRNNFYYKFTKNYFDETIATAIGNGFIYEKIHHKINKSQWYNNSIINTLAKAYYPLVKKYLQQGKKIDRFFLKQTVQIAKESFPHIQYQLEPHLNSISIESPNRSFRQLTSNFLKKPFQISSVYSSSHMTTQLKRTTFHLIPIKNKDLSRLSIQNQKGLYLFTIKARNKKDIKALLSKLIKIKKLPKNKMEILL